MEVFFSGHVQGVGFRYASYQVAKEFAVCGEVKNLPDGRVRLVAEGSSPEVRGFVDEVRDRMAPFIREVEEKTSEGPPKYKDFTIAR